MRKKFLLIFAILITLVVLYWNFRLDIEDYFFSKRVVFWSPNVALKYSDYQDKPNKNSESNIHYYYGLYLKANTIEKAFVRSYFDKNQSAIKDTTVSGIATEMKIQKLLFDLNEVYARKFNIEINKIKFDKKTKYQDLERIGKKIFLELDSKTDLIFHSRKSNSEILTIWRPKIDSLLVLYK